VEVLAQRVEIGTASAVGMADLMFPVVASSLALDLENTWQSTTAIGAFLLFLLMAINTIGSCCRLFDIAMWIWKICRCSVHGAQRFWKPASVQMVHKMTQSQTTYTWKAATPRFTPLPEYQHGAWND